MNESYKEEYYKGQLDYFFVMVPENKLEGIIDANDKSGGLWHFVVPIPFRNNNVWEFLKKL